jgi:hypothetical protein
MEPAARSKEGTVMVDSSAPVGQYQSRPVGRPRTVVPPEMDDLLERSYRTGIFERIPLQPEEMTHVNELVNLARVACRRAGKSLEYIIDLDRNILVIRMRDKRIYNRRTT